MQEDLIKSLQEALLVSPDNVPLRITLAKDLLHNQKIQKAEKEFKFVLEKQGDNVQTKSGLAKVYFEQEKYSTVIVILEELIEQKPNDVGLLILMSKSLLRNQETGKSMQFYKRALQLNPSLGEEELDQHLRVQSSPQNNVDDIIESLEQDIRELEKPSINFDDVGGMTKVKEEINVKIIQPLLYPELYKAYGKKIGGGILLYG